MNAQNINLNGFFIGKVLKHCSRGKCKVFVFGVYNDEYNSFEKSDRIPDAEQLMPLIGGCKTGSGIFTYPDVGSMVAVGFWNGDQNYPFYFASVNGADQNLSSYSDVCGKSQDSNEIKKGNDARVHMIKVDQSEIKIYESGEIELKVYDNKAKPKEDCASIKLDGTGNIELNASSSITINSPLISINCDNRNLRTQYNIETTSKVKSVVADEYNELITNTKNTVCTTENRKAKEQYVQETPLYRLDASTDTGIGGKIYLKGNRENTSIV